MIVTILGGALSIVTPVQVSYSSSAQDTNGDDQQEQPTDEGPKDAEPVDEPNDQTNTQLSDDDDLTEKEKDKVPTCAAKYAWNEKLKKCVWVGGGHWGTSIANETSPSADVIDEQQQQQLTLDIINSNELVVVNESTTDAIGDGGGDGPRGPGTASREVTCVKNSQGQIFCYEVLQPDENCLKPMNVEDPPLCRPPP